LRPIALDLFCGAGGATRGLQAAGYLVVGIDVRPQPRYCGNAFVQADALRPPLDPGRFALVWASPPCQHSTAYKRRPGHVRPCQNLIPETRAMLRAAGAPYVIENVEGAFAHLENPVTLCGSMFGLDVRRHRLFECSFPVSAPPCRHGDWSPRFAQATNRRNPRRTVEVGVYRIPLAVQQAAMGVDWMGLGELSQAIPPAFAEHIARAAPA
jgi:DNA (cytosine-5)-methyltransferase 1